MFLVNDGEVVNIAQKEMQKIMDALPDIEDLPRFEKINPREWKFCNGFHSFRIKKDCFHGPWEVSISQAGKEKYSRAFFASTIREAQEKILGYKW